MKLILSNVRIVLVGTTHPGNIGAAARAMKTMSQNNLYLVNPKDFPSAEATARAAGADDILANARIYTDLKSAIADCENVIMTTARNRSLSWPVVTPRQCAQFVGQHKDLKTAIVFGRESSGLSNEEIALANSVIKIPTNDEYSSLNLASAVQIICYEIMIEYLKHIKNNEEENLHPVNQEKLEQFYDHLEETMVNVGYYDKNNPKQLSRRLRRLFNRTLLDESEINIFRGFFSAIQSKVKNFK